MNPVTPLPPASRLAERLAWMHEPVHLRCAFLPWFVVRMLEQALHGYLCSLEQALLTLLDLHRQGKLEPWPEEAEAPRAQRHSNYTMTSNPAAASRSAGPKAVHLAASAEAVAEPDVEVAALGGLRAAVVIAARPALPRGAVSGGGRHQGNLRSPWTPTDRCGHAKFFRPIWALRENCA